ncbi:MAG: hypothetical protein BBJ57_12665 [Desulfobacterales bacterium PC51MH44]|nr:MAG: hypothetical protein BBJ57_12665 [Desulfobacterales bacterium PC51MH44]
MRWRKILAVGIMAAGVAFFVQRCDCPIIAIHKMGTWVPIGPEEIIESIYASPNSGRATVIAVNPHNSDDVWLGTATGGVWRSTNITSPAYQWMSVTEAAASLSIGAILLEDCSAQRCNTVWIGTGENNIRRDTYYGAGLLKLLWDTGRNDYTMSSVEDTENLFKHGSIIDIKRLGDLLYIAVSKGKSASASTTIVTAPEPAAGYGIHRSNDNGVTWEKVGTSPSQALPTDMEIHGGSLLLGFYEQGIFRLSAGDVWCPLGPAASVPAACPAVSDVLPNPSNTVFDHVEISVSPSNTDVIYAAYGMCSDSEVLWCKDPPLYHASPLFFVSQDGGTTWHSRVNNATIKTYSRYTHVLTVHPNFDNWVYYGGLKLWLSTNYGDNFALDPVAGKIHLDMQDLVYPDPNHPSILYAASDGGFYLVDETFPQTAIPLNHGLETVQFYSACSSDWEGSQLLLGGTQDNGTVFFTGSTIWEFVLGGDGGDCIVASDELFYGSLYNINPRRAVGPDLQYGSFSRFEDGIDSSDPSLFLPPFKMHPETHDLYFGTNRLYKRSQTDSLWMAVSPIFDTSPVELPETERRNSISAVALSKSNRNIIYVALSNGDIWVSEDTGPCTLATCWKQIGGAGIDNGLPISVPTSLDVDPVDEKIVYISYSDFSDNPKVWRSNDGGETWQSFSQGLPNNLPIKVIRVKPDQSNVIYLGSDNGVYRRNLRGTFEIFCIRFGKEWQFYGHELGIPRVPVYDITFDTANNLVYAATHGRGMYMLSDEPVIYTIIRFGNEGQQRLYLFGHAFYESKGSQCSISYLDEENKVLAQTSSDARGGELRINELGRLVGINKDKFGSTTMVAPCMEGDCLEDRKSGISLTKAGVKQFKLTCGEQSVTSNIKKRPTIQRNPSSTLFKVRKLSNNSKGRVYLTANPVGGAAKRISETEITASVDIKREDTEKAISLRLANSFNHVSQKRSADYRASVLLEKKVDKEGEDAHDVKPFIKLKSEKLEAIQIFTAFRTNPGEANELALDLESIGLSTRNELIPAKITFTTLAEGAKGGSIAFVQRTPAGICRFSLETIPGQSAEQFTGDLHSALINMPYPGTKQCESRHNTYDLQLQDNSIVTSTALGISIEIRDPGVGVSVSPLTGTGGLGSRFN